MASSIISAIPANLLAHQSSSPQIVFGLAPNLQLEMRPSVCQRLSAELSNLFITKPKPSRRRRVRRITPAFQDGKPFGLPLLSSTQNLERLCLRQRIGDISKIDSRHNLFRRHVGQQPPDRLTLGLGIKIPYCVDQRAGGKMNHALRRP